MNPELEQLEREIDRQLAALAQQLRTPAPRPSCIAEVKAAVGEEARRLHRRQRRFLALRPWAGVAAAMLLALGLSLPRGSEPAEVLLGPAKEADAILADWLDALGESGEQFTRMFEEDWLLGDFGPAGEENGETVDPLDSLEESLKSFERMIEA